MGSLEEAQRHASAQADLPRDNGSEKLSAGLSDLSMARGAKVRPSNVDAEVEADKQRAAKYATGDARN